MPRSAFRRAVIGMELLPARSNLTYSDITTATSLANIPSLSKMM
jgi:hypothetical protein